MRHTRGPVAEWTEDEELLLASVVASPEEASAAWQRLRPRFHLDRDDHEWYRMIPPLWRNLSLAGIDDPEMPRMKGVFRRTWADTQLLLGDLERALDALHGAELDTMVIKGAGLIASGLLEAGARLMDDIDVAVRPETMHAAEDALARAGWIRKPLTLPPDVFAVPLANESGRQLDLHRRIAPELTVRRSPGASDAGFWERAVPVAVGGVRTTTLCPADHLLLVCAHGLRGRGSARLHWVPDAAALIRSGHVDWDTVLMEARRHHAVLFMRDRLSALARVGVAAPGRVRAGLGRPVPSPRDHLIHWARTSPPPSVGFLRLVRLWAQRTAHLSLREAGSAWPAHVRSFYGITRWRQVPGRAAVRVARRLSR